MARKPGEWVAACNRYAAAVESGERPSCKWEKLAVARYRRDIRKSIRKDWPYRFDSDAAEHACDFIERLPHVKGKWANNKELLVLGDWQCFIVCNLFGWLVKAGFPRAGLRRFLEAYLEICRKNGKSVLAAAIGVYMWCMDQETGAEVYSGATTESQAWEVFRPARLMVEKSEDLVAALGGSGVVRAKKLLIHEDQSRFEPLIGDPGDGASPSCAIADEYHEHQTDRLVETMRTGMLSREQPLLLTITTAGVNLAGPCYDKRTDCQKLLEGTFDNDALFAIIYSIDLPEGDKPGDDWTDPKVLIKANPNFGVSVDPDILGMAHRQAVMNPANQVAFKTKHLNIWCAARVIWMPIEVWDGCKDAQLSRDEFAGESCWVTLDLASKDDIAAYGQHFARMQQQGGKQVLHHYIFTRYYVPKMVLETPGPNQVAYRRWAGEGWLTIAGEKEIDFEFIERDVKKDAEKTQVIEMLFDPWRATDLAQRMERSGAVTVEVKHTVGNLSLPMKEVLSAGKAVRLHHDGNPVTRWMVSNVTCMTDAKDNIYPRKEKPHMKIDGAVTTIMGMSRAMLMGGASINDWLNQPVVAERAKVGR
jgi:phage terminase large subunit-like protein